MGLGSGLRFWAQVLGLGSGLGLRLWAGLPHGGSRRRPHRALLLNAAQDTWRRARRARGAEQRRHTVGPASGTMLVGVAVVAARRRRSMLCSPDSSRPCRSTTSCVAERERQVPHHPRYRPSVSDTEPVTGDTPPVSQIPGWYPSCSLPHRTEMVALATSHTTHCCNTLRRSRRAAHRAAQVATSRRVAHGGRDRRFVGVVVAEIRRRCYTREIPPHVQWSVAVRVYCDAFGLSQGNGPCYRLLDLWLLFSRATQRPRA